ncbi:aminotransferase class I/II-fold pyridoxal phosphate-dependent enzyme [Actinacidiphila acididurans]|uniref:Aminotransferase class I/II-fold pyridoxal phosphate-dependent enzyme n=1 Tax=Actinacidiphila acididurans TaxID=2784346 RepID=A0ABS2TUS0_9ACTN|nr:aminotransferase class I/II-fold pyridoxal phosphate-dependent enzyme [Actinacidiphila acididurans]MBM9507077.1 aminotransferase class I/II-fold pyridoxal phosphate-dependent enzyme [Actinacidiphila acididurans]
MRADPPYDLRPDPGLPVPAYWDANLSSRTGAEPAGGGRAVLEAAAGYWARRGLPTDAPHLAVAPGAEVLLAALLAAVDGDLVIARPAAAWQAPVAALLGRRVHTSPAPAEGGGVPDPFALLETVRRARADGGTPRLLLLSAVDDPSGTVTAPELLHETCEAAAEAGLVIVSDETYSDTLHHHETVLLSPAEMLPDHTVVLTDLGATLVPATVPCALARFPASGHGLSWRERTAAALAALRAVLPGPVADAAAYVLGEPAEVTDRTAAANRLHARVAAAAYRAVTAAGALCRPPKAGFQLYPTLSAHDLDAAGAQQRLTEALGRPVLGGHVFGDDPLEPRVRIDTGALHGATETERRTALAAADPLTVPHIAAALTALTSALAEISEPDPVPDGAGTRSRGGGA